uniref:Si:ch73-389k6.1 n=1 Tax=Syphacia muris TaxID=451379 RepID=A0A0N5ACY3_9BILA
MAAGKRTPLIVRTRKTTASVASNSTDSLDSISNDTFIINATADITTEKATIKTKTRTKTTSTTFTMQRTSRKQIKIKYTGIMKWSTKARSNAFTKPHKETTKRFEVNDDKDSEKRAEKENSRSGFFIFTVFVTIIALSVGFAIYRFYFLKRKPSLYYSSKPKNPFEYRENGSESSLE